MVVWKNVLVSTFLQNGNALLLACFFNTLKVKCSASAAKNVFCFKQNRQMRIYESQCLFLYASQQIGNEISGKWHLKLMLYCVWQC